ncbi:hypothetical protein SDRG_11827 [Saprolegnia diclina VS20]|uniref:GH16 domain-containing protein n=1 Tax=Saprolegnia diclina (strain VS20) TaxID=1156394 RepID=T0QAI5_SAPDV|nr:hypothetical protein SDRG_11827 [Saprolegnia diclina VS20]EQC30510.1 hypothetical protein SDRG_11827 [Saprolegnia diclina VS20]|eukprot:XP_008616103.1 hypothetical protein SDRG_11827 [Saprolegnia diclina VS20]
MHCFSRHVRMPLIALSVALALDQNDPTLPTKSGVKTWVDVETPAQFHTMTSSRGDRWDLVMSDEFNLAGRDFTAGHDHLWVALDMPDGVNRAVGTYATENAFTADGAFQIRVDSVETNITYFNVWADVPSWQNKTMYYRAGMVQTWNKFCIQGGFVEIAAKLPGAINPESMNPHVTGKLWNSTLQRSVPVKPLDRIPDLKFYPTWPGLWMMGNLGRALFAASTNRMWPWTYNECDERYRTSQRISACDPNPGYGLHPNMGRGAPELDLVEGGGSDISSSLQLAPGMPEEYRLFPPQIKYEGVNNTDAKGRRGIGSTLCLYGQTCLTPGANMVDIPTSVYAARGHKSWYQGLRYAANNRCTPVEAQRQAYASVAAAQNGTIDDNQFDIKTISAGPAALGHQLQWHVLSRLQWLHRVVPLRP